MLFGDEQRKHGGRRAEHRPHATGPATHMLHSAKKEPQQQHGGGASPTYLPADAAARAPATVPGVPPSEDSVLMKIEDERWALVLLTAAARRAAVAAGKERPAANMIL